MANKRFPVMVSVALGLLAIPYVAMQFTSQVNWSVFDFLMMALLLIGLCVGIELTLRNVKTFKNRMLVCGVILLAVLLIWAELAVGIFGSPLAGS